MTEERKGFVIYRSIYASLKFVTDPTKRAKAYDAICEYAFNGTEPNFNEDILNVIWLNIKPVLDNDRKQYFNGKQGGRPISEIITQPKPNDNLNETQSEVIHNSDSGFYPQETQPKPNLSKNILTKSCEYVSLINNNIITTGAREDVDNLREPFLKMYDDYFFTYEGNDEMIDRGKELIDVMIMAKMQAIKPERLTFAGTTYSLNDFSKILINITSDKFSEIIFAVKKKKEINDRYFYILGVLFKVYEKYRVPYQPKPIQIEKAV